MDDMTTMISFKGKSGTNYLFTHCYNLLSDNVPGNEGIYVFTTKTKAESHILLDVQLLQSQDEIKDTIARMKDDGAVYAFFKTCNDELGCDAEIDDIKSSDDYRIMVD